MQILQVYMVYLSDFLCTPAYAAKAAAVDPNFKFATKSTQKVGKS